MYKRIAALGVVIASKHLGLSDIEIEYRNQQFFMNDQVNAIFIQTSFTIVFSLEWLERASDFEILKCAFHETRHAFQKACIEFPHVMRDKPDKKIIEVWKKEFNSYKNPIENSYLDQNIEKDAIEFSEKFLNKVINDLKDM